MSFQFKPFKDGWLQYGELFDPFAQLLKYTTSLSPEFFYGLEFDQETLRQYRIDAALSAADQLGDNPVLCLSGGIDSQAMIQCWAEADLKFDVAIGVFNNNLNTQDTEHAKLFCKKFGITPIEVEIDVVTFLSRDNLSFGEKYRCTSPHFNTHYYMFDKLRGMGYTGICCGGTAFAKGKDNWGPVPSPPQMNYVEYARLNQYPVIGNFLGYDPKLCWTIALLTPPHDKIWHGAVLNAERIKKDSDARYTAKVIGYQAHGFDIIPQDQKYTGFELVKDYYAEKYKDGWTFEKKFRIPLERKLGTAAGTLVLTQEQKLVLDDLYNKRGFSG